MTQKSRIFVHGAKAHADEMWACGLLIASNPGIEFTEIIRDAKRVGEATENDYILDCGMKFDGEHFFDHHQFESTEDVDCTLTLIAKRFAPWTLTDTKFGPVIERVRVQDNSGIIVSEQQFGKSSPWIASEFVLLNLFEVKPLEVANIIAYGFRRRLAEIKETERAKTWLESNSHIEIVEEKVKVFVCEESPFKAGFSIQAYNAASREVINKEKIEVAYGWNGDGSGNRSLFRTGYGKFIDLTKTAPERLVFCHNGGFLLVFDPADEAEYRKLVLQAYDYDEKTEKIA